MEPEASSTMTAVTPLALPLQPSGSGTTPHGAQSTSSCAPAMITRA